MRHAIAGVLLVAGVAGCTKSGDDAPAKRPSAPPASGAAVSPARVSLAQFKALSWIEGHWRGKLPDGRPFFEVYRRINDSTIHEASFPDSSFKSQGDSATIELRSGVILNGDLAGGKRWIATRIDSLSIEFTSPDDQSRHFTWTRHPDGSWEAALFSPDGGGIKQTVYLMERMKR